MSLILPDQVTNYGLLFCGDDGKNVEQKHVMLLKSVLGIGPLFTSLNKTCGPAQHWDEKDLSLLEKLQNYMAND